MSSHQRGGVYIVFGVDTIGKSVGMYFLDVY